MADSTVVYRGASLEDLPELARLRWNWRANDEQQADADRRRSFLGECERFLSDGLSSGWHYFVAADEHAIMASIFVLTIRKVPELSACADAYGYLTNVFVAQDRERQGIGGVEFPRFCGHPNMLSVADHGGLTAPWRGCWDTTVPERMR